MLVTIGFKVLGFGLGLGLGGCGWVVYGSDFACLCVVAFACGFDGAWLCFDWGIFGRVTGETLVRGGRFREGNDLFFLHLEKLLAGAKCSVWGSVV